MDAEPEIEPLTTLSDESPANPRRYVWTLLNRRYHDTEHLSERCNTDQIIAKRYSAEPPKTKIPCRHCNVV